MTTVVFLPWPPSTNNMYARTRKGGVYLTRQVKLYREEVGWACREQKAARYQGQRLAVHVLACANNDEDRDLDNLLKPLLDALEYALVIDDDANVDDLHVVRGPTRKGRKRGQVLVTIRDMDDPTEVD